MVFCNNCENILKKTTIDGVLHNICPQCGYSEESDENIVYNELSKKDRNTQSYIDSKYDISLPRKILKKSSCVSKNCVSRAMVVYTDGFSTKHICFY